MTTIKINNADDTWFIAREDATGAATGKLFSVPFIPGSRLDYTSDMTASKTQMPARAAGASRRNNFSVKGGLDMDLQACDAFEVMLESLLAGQFDADGKLVAGTTQSTFYAEERYINAGVVNANLYHGCDATSIAIDAKFSGDNVSMKMQCVGLNGTTATAASDLTVQALGPLTPFSGQDVSAVSIAGLTNLYYSELSFSVEAKKDSQGALGSAAAIGTAQDGPKTIKFSVTGYRSDFTPETVIGNGALAVGFTAMLGGVGYQFTIPAARGSIPANTTDGGSRMWKVDFMGEFDPTTATDIIVQKLPVIA